MLLLTVNFFWPTNRWVWTWLYTSTMHVRHGWRHKTASTDLHYNLTVSSCVHLPSRCWYGSANEYHLLLYPIYSVSCQLGASQILILCSECTKTNDLYSTNVIQRPWYAGAIVSEGCKLTLVVPRTTKAAVYMYITVYNYINKHTKNMPPFSNNTKYIQECSSVVIQQTKLHYNDSWFPSPENSQLSTWTENWQLHQHKQMGRQLHCYTVFWTTMQYTVQSFNTHGAR